MKKSKISLALAYLAAHPGSSAYAAARHAQLNPSALYKRLKLIEAHEAGRCPTCGKPA